jgi:hypothetical protein
MSSFNNGSITIEWLTALLPNAVLLPIPERKKGPVIEGWSQVKLLDTILPDYRKDLSEHTNTGVLLGRPSKGLCAIDVDSDEAAELLLALNPDFQKTLRSRGRRGCQFWVETDGEYPHCVAKLKYKTGAPFGEWRADGGQSVIRGIHPDGMHYQLLCDAPPLRIRFDKIRWPLELVLPWEKEALPNENPTSRCEPPPVSEISERVRAYLDKVPASVAGNGGDDQLFRAASILVNGFGLSPEEALPFLREYNARAEPPWLENRLAYKLAEALEEGPPPGKPCGYLLLDSKPNFQHNIVANIAVGGSPQCATRNGEQAAANGEKNQLILPCPKCEINESARECFTVLRKTLRYFTRDRTVFEVVYDEDGNLRLIELDPAAFRSQLESYFRLAIRRTLPDGQTVIVIENRCSVDSAIALLKADPTFELLPRIKILTAAAVFTEIDGRIEALKEGYHDILGGILVTRKREIIEVDLKEATASLLALLDDFDFVSGADRSRALANFISPALRLGGLLPADFPLDLSEANESQSGKTYRQKVVCALYGEEPFVLNKNEDSGVGSLDERASDGLISGKPFLMIENLRGPIRSQLVESALRGAGLVQARRAYSRSVQVKTNRVCWMLSSNKAETTPDLANRSIITRIRKQAPGYAFKTFDEGDLLRHVEAKSDYYLSCVLSVLREWYSKGRPRTDDTRHDFREWCQTLDWIVQNIFGCSPLLEGHRSEQARISNPNLNWLRDVGVCAEKDDRLEKALKPAEISELCEAHGIDIPGCSTRTDDDQKSMTTGKILKRLFANTNTIEVGSYLIRRETRDEYNPFRKAHLPVHYHFFERQK